MRQGERAIRTCIRQSCKKRRGRSIVTEIYPCSNLSETGDRPTVRHVNRVCPRVASREGTSASTLVGSPQKRGTSRNNARDFRPLFARPFLSRFAVSTGLTKVRRFRTVSLRDSIRRNIPTLLKKRTTPEGGIRMTERSGTPVLEIRLSTYRASSPPITRDVRIRAIPHIGSSLALRATEDRRSPTVSTRNTWQPSVAPSASFEESGASLDRFFSVWTPTPSPRQHS
jgi:hypothetical protein